MSDDLLFGDALRGLGNHPLTESKLQDDAQILIIIIYWVLPWSFPLSVFSPILPYIIPILPQYTIFAMNNKASKKPFPSIVKPQPLRPKAWSSNPQAYQTSCSVVRVEPHTATGVQSSWSQPAASLS